MGALRGRPDQARAAVLSERLRGFDYELMDLVLAYQEDLPRSVAAELVEMHRSLRRMRYEIEVRAGIEADHAFMRQQDRFHRGGAGQ